jgi:nicotinamidase-related amidase
MEGEKLDTGRSALLIFDMLNGHLTDSDSMPRRQHRPAIANAKRLLAAARATRIMVAYAVANHRADSATSALLLTDTDNRLRPWGAGIEPMRKPVIAGGTWEAQVIDDLAPRPEDYIVPKYRWSAFHQTYLDLALRARRVDTLVLLGGSTDIGIASTAFAARDLDYHLVIPHDACTALEADNHEQFIRRIFPRMARVRTTEQVLAMLGSPLRVPPPRGRSTPRVRARSPRKTPAR